MAKVSYSIVPEDLTSFYSRTLTFGSRLQSPRVRRYRAFMSRNQKKGFSAKSLLPEVAELWATFSPEEKAVWNAKAVVERKSGFKFLLRDYVLRKANDLTGYFTPEAYWGLEVGKIVIEEPATSLKIAQLHPRNYLIKRKKTGTIGQYNIVKITEGFGLPLELKISYKSNLTSAGANPKARFYAEILSHYQGREILTELSCDFDLVSDWTQVINSISGVVGIEKGYTIYIELEDVQGTLYFDNVEINHSGQNWARDKFCDNIRQAFTGSYFMVPRHWVGVDVPTGSFYDSFYYPLDL
jgi:hypothetical protein